MKESLISSARAAPISAVPAAGALVREAVASGGAPLSRETRSIAEARLGASFGNVRVTPTPAASLPANLAVGARGDSFEAQADSVGADFARPRPVESSESEPTPPRADLGAVRVHTGAQAEAATDALDASAFTVANHVVLGDGAASDDTLAHELAHVAQQSTRAPSIQCKPKKDGGQKKPLSDASKLTEAKKAAKRLKIRQEAEQLTEDALIAVRARPFTADDQKRIEGMKKQLLAARDAIEKRKDDEEKKIRRQYVDAMLSSLGNAEAAKYHAWIGTTIVPETLGRMLDRNDKAPKEILAQWRYQTYLIRGGARRILIAELTERIYKRDQIDPKSLEPEEPTDAKATDPAPDSGSDSPSGVPSEPPRQTDEERKVLQDLYGSLPEAGQSADVGDEQKLLEELQSMDPDQRDQFKRYLQSTNKPGTEPKPLSVAAAEFKALSPVDKEVLEVNKDIAEADPTGKEKRLDGPVLLQLKNDAQQLASGGKDYKKLRANLERLKSTIVDKSQIKDFPNLGADVDMFVNEFAMGEGLLAGGAAGSPLVESVVKKLVADLINARVEIFKQLARDLAIAGALLFVPGGTLVKMAHTLKKLYDKLAALQKVYATVQKVERIIQAVAGFPDTYRKFHQTYEKVVAAYEKGQALLNSIEGEDDLEERVEREMDRLTEQLEEQIEGKFGEVLEMMYIPDDTTPEDLMKILMNIPRGFDALKHMWEFYKSPQASGPNAEEILMVRGFRAGRLLYPFVGLLAAEMNDALSKFLDRKSMRNRFDKLMPRGQRTGGRDRGRGLFRRRNRKRVKIPDAVLNEQLDAGRKKLRTLIDKDEPGTRKQWAPAWLRFSLRREIKLLNSEFSKVRVTADVEQKAGKGQPKKVIKEQVPLPEFRLKFTRARRGAKKAKVLLRLNPEKPLDPEPELLTNDDFKDPGVEYTGTEPKRQEAIRDWLSEAGYQTIYDNNRKLHLRLPGGERESKDRSYLHFKGNSIVEGIGPDDYEQFLKRPIDNSSDLPEGYLLMGASKAGKTDDPGAIVQRKGGAADKYKLKRLGIDTNQKLKLGDSDKQVQKLWPAGITECVPEEYHWQSSIDAMFAESGYNLQGKDKNAWLKHAGKTEGLKNRPKYAAGPLGYTINARAESDQLASRHLPELKTRDDKGHLIARRFAGTDSLNNLIPMKRSLNQAPGKWFDMEQDMAEVYKGTKDKRAKPNEYVSFEVGVQYPNLQTRRPNKIHVKWQRRTAKVAQKPDFKSDPAADLKSKLFDND